MRSNALLATAGLLVQGTDHATSDSQSTRSLSVVLALAAWMLLAAAIGQFVLIYLLGDIWWLGTVALFAPRWLLVAPLVGVSAMCALRRRRLLWVCFASAILLAGPVMGFCLRSVFTRTADGAPLRVMTANIGSGADWGRLNEIIDRERPDIVALQEVGQDWSETVLGPGWYWKHGAGTAIASRYPIVSTSQFPANGIDRWGDIAVIIVINLPQGNAKICCIHLNTPRWGLDELALTRYGLVGLDALRKNTRDRESESRNVRAWIADSEMPTIVAGDFNMPIESSIYRRYWSGFQNAFSVAGRGYGYSKYTRWHGVRIDHILVNQNWNVVSCHVAAPTGGDHQPVIADLRLSM